MTSYVPLICHTLVRLNQKIHSDGHDRTLFSFLERNAPFKDRHKTLVKKRLLQLVKAFLKKNSASLDDKMVSSIYVIPYKTQ